MLVDIRNVNRSSKGMVGMDGMDGSIAHNY